MIFLYLHKAPERLITLLEQAAETVTVAVDVSRRAPDMVVPEPNTVSNTSVALVQVKLELPMLFVAPNTPTAFPAELKSRLADVRLEAE
jgi:hypothetical protein